MAEFFALTGTPLPAGLHGTDADFSIRTLTDRERLAIEDYFLKKDDKTELTVATTAVVVPQNQTLGATMKDFGVLIEFALAVLTVSGFQPVTVVAALNDSKCTEALRRPSRETAVPAMFPKKVVKAAASTWMRHFFAARRKANDKLHITADRFVRYSRTNDSHDALVDLCICLESLIEVPTEISFRFSTCLAKVTGAKDAEEISNLLLDLYDLRSKVVHGADFIKQHRKIEPNIAKLRLAARTILTAYVLYLTEHTKEDWKKHLRSSLFA